MITEMITMLVSTLNIMWVASGIKEVQMGFGMFLGLLITIKLLKDEDNKCVFSGEGEQ